LSNIADGIGSVDQAERTRCNAGICDVQGRSSHGPSLPHSQTAIPLPIIPVNPVTVGEENPGKKTPSVEAGRKSTRRK
jgi:hypothetical protein